MAIAPRRRIGRRAPLPYHRPSFGAVSAPTRAVAVLAHPGGVEWSDRPIAKHVGVDGAGRGGGFGNGGPKRRLPGLPPKRETSIVESGSPSTHRRAVAVPKPTSALGVGRNRE